MKPLVNAPLIPEHPLSRAMLYRWLTNEGGGRGLNEAVSGRRRITTNGVPWIGSPRGRSLRFNGTSHFGTASLQLGTVQKLTVAFNYYRATAPTTAKMVGELSSNSNSFPAGAFYIADGYNTATDANGAFFSTALYASQSGTKATGATIAQPAAGIRHRIMLVYDRTLSSNQITAIYVNGVPQTITYGTTISPIAAPSTFRDDTFYFMARGGSSLFTAGDADDWTFWTRCLTPIEAEADYADPYQMFDRSPASGIWVPSNYNQALTLTAETGVFTVSGQDADLIVNQGGQTLNLAPGKPRQIRYSARINGELVTGTYEEIQALILRIAEQEAEKAADEAIKEAKKPKRAPFLRILPGKPVEKTEEVEPERIVAKPLVTEYEDAYRRFLDKLISERLAAQIAAEMDDEEALLLLL